MKKRLVALLISGIGLFGSNLSGQEIKDTTSNNKKLYSDFIEFVGKNGKETSSNSKSYIYSVDFRDSKLSEKFSNYVSMDVEQNKVKYLLIQKKNSNGSINYIFTDENANGMKANEKEDEASLLNTRIDLYTGSKKFREFNPTEQQQIKEEYEYSIREIMHDAKFKNY
jgi:hypothetical protein